MKKKKKILNNILNYPSYSFRSVPYESSKRTIDLIAIGLNSRLNKHNIYSFTTHPGVAATNIVRDHLGWIMGYGMLIGLYAVNIISKKM
jgi:hypothetical protein